MTKKAARFNSVFGDLWTKHRYPSFEVGEILCKNPIYLTGPQVVSRELVEHWEIAHFIVQRTRANEMLTECFLRILIEYTNSYCNYGRQKLVRIHNNQNRSGILDNSLLTVPKAS